MAHPYYTLTKEVVDAELAILRRGREKRLASKETALAALIRAGLLTKTGKPKRRYYGDPKENKEG